MKSNKSVVQSRYAEPCTNDNIVKIKANSSDPENQVKLR